jgi:hypothetical protein
MGIVDFLRSELKYELSDQIHGKEAEAAIVKDCYTTPQILSDFIDGIYSSEVPIRHWIILIEYLFDRYKWY